MQDGFVGLAHVRRLRVGIASRRRPSGHRAHDTRGSRATRSRLPRARSLLGGRVCSEADARAARARGGACVRRVRISRASRRGSVWGRRRFARATASCPSASGSRAPCATRDSCSSGRLPRRLGQQWAGHARARDRCGDARHLRDDDGAARRRRKGKRQQIDSGYPGPAAGGGGKGMRVHPHRRESGLRIGPARSPQRLRWFEKYVVGPAPRGDPGAGRSSRHHAARGRA